MHSKSRVSQPQCLQSRCISTTAKGASRPPKFRFHTLQLHSTVRGPTTHSQKMRSSRISKDTSKLFGSAPVTRTSPPRRTTRSLSRFVYASTSSTSANQNVSRTPDIEDSIRPPPKRRRRTSTDSPMKAMKTELPDEPLSSVPSPPAKRRARKPAKKTTDPTTGEERTSPPSDWQEMYNAVKKMRSPGGVAHGAAVDTMGCERLADRSASPKDQRFHTLIALMLSSQTKDTVNAVAMKRLQTELPPHKPGAPPGLNLDNVLAVDASLLNQLIWAVGFHNNKTKYVSPHMHEKDSSFEGPAKLMTQVHQTSSRHLTGSMERRHPRHHPRPHVAPRCRPQDGPSLPLRGVGPHRRHRRRRARPPDHEPLGVEQDEKPGRHAPRTAVVAAERQVAGNKLAARRVRAGSLPAGGEEVW